MSEKDLIPQNDTEITIVEEEQGLAIFGNPQLIENWLAEHNLDSKDLTPNLLRAARTADASAQIATQYIEQSGRWVKLTKESAAIAKATQATSGVARASNGQIINHLKFAQVGGIFTPAGAVFLSGVMAQYAMEQQLSEITDYLKQIDQKLDDLIQDQKDKTFSELFAFRHAVDEAALIRESTGKVSSVTWSKVANIGQETARIQKYALQKLENLEKDIHKAKLASSLDESTKKASREIQTWLLVLGNALYIQDQLAVIEIDRVLEDDPESLENHKKAIYRARANRFDEIRETLGKMNAVLDPSWQKAKAQQVLSYKASKNSFNQLNRIDSELDKFSPIIGIEENDWSAENTRGWFRAAKDLAGEKAKQVSSGVQQAKKGISENLPQIEINVNLGKKNSSDE